MKNFKKLLMGLLISGFAMAEGNSIGGGIQGTPNTATTPEANSLDTDNPQVRANYTQTADNASKRLRREQTIERQRNLKTSPDDKGSIEKSE